MCAPSTPKLIRQINNKIIYNIIAAQTLANTFTLATACSLPGWVERWGKWGRWCCGSWLSLEAGSPFVAVVIYALWVFNMQHFKVFTTDFLLLQAPGKAGTNTHTHTHVCDYILSSKKLYDMQVAAISQAKIKMQKQQTKIHSKLF